MRLAVFFLIGAAAWLAVNGWRDAGRAFDQASRYFGLDRVSEDAPNWGDVADKIGDLASERDDLRQGLPPQSAETPQ